MKINQINFSYSPLEDRLLFRLNTLDKTEFRMWLTRAICIKLLGHLHRVVKTDLQREQPGLGQAAMQTVEEFRCEAVLAKTDFVKSFSPEAETFPFGPQPILVVDIVMDSSRQTSVATFRLAIGQEINLSLDHNLGVAITIRKLLSDVVDGLDWGVEAAKELPIAGTGNLGEKMMFH